MMASRWTSFTDVTRSRDKRAKSSRKITLTTTTTCAVSQVNNNSTISQIMVTKTTTNHNLTKTNTVRINMITTISTIRATKTTISMTTTTNTTSSRITISTHINSSQNNNSISNSSSRRMILIWLISTAPRRRHLQSQCSSTRRTRRLRKRHPGLPNTASKTNLSKVRKILLTSAILSQSEREEATTGPQTPTPRAAIKQPLKNRRITPWLTRTNQAHPTANRARVNNRTTKRSWRQKPLSA